MTDGDETAEEGDDADAPGEAEEPAEAEESADELSTDTLDSRLDEAGEALEAAETEAELDEIESDLDAIESDLAAADLPGPEAEDEESAREQYESRLSDLREDLESQRGPYAADVVATVEDAQSTLTESEWTEQGQAEIVDAVNVFLDDAGDALGEEFNAVDGDAEALAGELDAVIEAVEAADLDADEDAETIAALVAATDGLETGLTESEEWDDLETHEQLQAQGFFDVLGHYKDFPVEWAALKEHEQQGNADMIMLALDSLGSEFMERHCLEALERMGAPEAFDEMHQRAQKRDRPAIRILGKIGDDRAVDTLLEYVDADSDPQLQKVTFKALGEIGSEEATQALANKLEMDNDNVRPYAARALGLIGDTRAIDPLAAVLETDESDNVRAAAAWALRQIGTEAALEAAAEYSGDRSFIVQEEARAAADSLDAASA